MKKQRVPVLVLALSLSLAAFGRADAQPGTEDEGIHGMLVVGRETPYISHLPMFTDKHRY